MGGWGVGDAFYDKKRTMKIFEFYDFRILNNSAYCLMLKITSFVHYVAWIQRYLDFLEF